MTVQDLIEALRQLPLTMPLRTIEPNGVQLPIPRLGDLCFYVVNGTLFINEHDELFTDEYGEETGVMRLANYLSGATSGDASD